MKFGLTDEQYEFIQTTVVTPLVGLNATVWIFGSRARGDYRKFSDLDLVIATDMDISDKVGEIEENLIDSNFPYKVDLILENHLASSYKEDYLKDRKPF